MEQKNFWCGVNGRTGEVTFNYQKNDEPTKLENITDRLEELSFFAVAAMVRDQGKSIASGSYGFKNLEEELDEIIFSAVARKIV